MGWFKRFRQDLQIEWAHELLKEPGDKARAKERFDRIVPERLTDRYLELARAVRDERRPDARRFRVVLSGTALRDGATAPNKASGFARSYEIVAATVEDACQLATELEPERTWAKLVISESEDIGDGGNENIGVTFASETVWYRER